MYTEHLLLGCERLPDRFSTFDADKLLVQAAVEVVRVIRCRFIFLDKNDGPTPDFHGPTPDFAFDADKLLVQAAVEVVRVIRCRA